MAMFDNAENQARKDSLKKLEDKRLALAERLAAQGFAPDEMLFAQNDDGGFTAISRFKGEYWLIVAPGFGSDGEFIVEHSDALDYRVQEVYTKPEGMGGLFGFGKKAEVGSEFIIRMPSGGEAKLGLVSGRGGWLRCEYKKNPLLKTRRRRGDANVVWDFRPMDRSEVDAALKIAAQYFPEARS